MTLFITCIAVVILSILYLGGWFFSSIYNYQERIDNDN